MKRFQCILSFLPCVAIHFCAIIASADDIAFTSASGRVMSFAMDGDYLDVQTNLSVRGPGWKTHTDLNGYNTEGVKFIREGDLKKWTGRMKLKDAGPIRFEHTVRQADGAVYFSGQLLAVDSDVAMEQACFDVSFPISIFNGGECVTPDANGSVRTIALPVEKPAKRHLVFGDANRVAMTSRGGSARVEITMPRKMKFLLQDNREYGGKDYSLSLEMGSKTLLKNKPLIVEAVIRVNGVSDHSLAELTVDASKPRYTLDGFGGCYCFDVNTPVAQYTLDNLRVAWARTEMKLEQWASDQSKIVPGKIDWDYFKSKDKPGSKLHHDFLMAQELTRRNIPYVISVWRLPPWLYAPEEATRDSMSPRHIATDKWPELLEAIGSYLLYAKKEYGVEPVLFSFNEPDYGVRVKLNGQQHREAILKIGKHLESLALKTKMLLADVASPNAKLEIVTPTLEDPQAMKYVGAIAFHSWGGAKPAVYTAWADLADKAGLPLLVTEVGLDADWRTVNAWRDTNLYAMREFCMIQDLLLYARPRGTMYWEFTEDYSVVNKKNTPGDGAPEITPKKLFWALKHFHDLTPPKAQAITSTSSTPKVYFTAFTGPAGGKADKTLVLHIANAGASRPTVITGLPAGISELHVIRTGPDDSFTKHQPVKVVNGVVKLELPAQTLTSLTAGQ